MPLAHLLFRCPECGQDPIRGQKDRVVCPSCGTAFRRNRYGDDLEVRRPGGDTRRTSVVELLDAITGQDAPPEAGADGPARRTAPARYHGVLTEDPLRARGALLGFVERPGAGRLGRLVLTDEALSFRADGAGKGDHERWRLLDLTALQISSGALQVGIGRGRTVEIDLMGASALRWKLLLEDAIRSAWRDAGRGEIAEFQPRIEGAGARSRARDPSAGGDRRRPGYGARRPGATGPRPRGGACPRPSRTLNPVATLLLGLPLRYLAPTHIEGREHVPREGPFVLVANHASILDPLLVQIACPRPLYTMTKSTEFRTPRLRRLLTKLGAFPVRRYRVDPQVVRVVLGLLDRGEGVAVYPEAERTWDGRLQAFRRGTVRLLLKSGVPIVPCGISGSFELLPRWSRTPRRGPVTVRFGEPLRWGRHDSRAAREGALDAASGELRERITALLDGAPPHSRASTDSPATPRST